MGTKIFKVLDGDEISGTLTGKSKGRIMFINPIVGVDEGVLPMGASILISCLRDAGHSVELFDTTKYKISQGHRSDDHGVKEINEKYLNFVPVTEGHQVEAKPIVTEEMLLDMFDEQVKQFKPHVLAFSVLCSHNYGMTKKLMARLTYKGAKVILGGKHVITTYKELIKVPWCDAVCIGDGEKSLINFCDAVVNKKDYTKIKNLWVKTDGNIEMNPLAKLIQMDEIPYPDWTDFDQRLFYKPFRGRMYRYGYVEISRGCPFRCPYCHNDKEHDLFAGLGKFMRTKSVKAAVEECKFLKEKYNLEIVKFLDEEFLAKPKAYLREFAKEYAKIDLPFLIAVRPERMTKENAELLASMGCVQASIGVEAGNDYIRKEVYQRPIENEVMIQGFKNFREAGICTTSLNMIGGPYEDCDTIFDTIELNRHLKPDDILCSVFQPYRGTSLRDLCVKEGWMPDDEECEETTLENSVLDMPQITHEEIWGFRRTFALYTRIPKTLYPLLGLYRKWDNSFTRWIFRVLAAKYSRRNGVSYIGHGANGRGWSDKLGTTTNPLEHPAEKGGKVFTDYEESQEFAGGLENLSRNELKEIMNNMKTAENRVNEQTA